MILERARRAALSDSAAGRSHEDYSRPGRTAFVGFCIIAGFIAALTLWSTLAPVSGAAIANGNLQVQGRRQAVQHPYGGVVKELLTREGERVEKGRVLMTLFDSDPRSKLDVLIAEQDGLGAQEARLIAERDGATPDFQTVLRSRDNAPSAQQAVANEQAIMTARQRQFQTEIEVLRQKTAQLREQIGGTKAQLDGTDKQRELLQEETNGAVSLLERGYTPKTRVLALQRSMAGLDADRGARLADIARMNEEISQTNLEVAKADRVRLSEITDQLRKAQSQLVELKPKIDAAQDVLNRTQITAPATGAVVGLAVFTEGGVISPGARLLDIVPSANPLMVDARLRLTDVNEVAAGKRADVRLTSINQTERPKIGGTIQTVSADRITDDKTGEGYYAIQVTLDADDVKRSRIELQAGMPAEVIVTTKPRTLVEYLVSPLRDELSGALREK